MIKELPLRIWISGRIDDGTGGCLYLHPRTNRVEYILREEHEHLLRIARAETFEEAAKMIDDWTEWICKPDNMNLTEVKKSFQEQFREKSAELRKEK